MEENKKIAHHFLFPSKLFFNKEEHQVDTILGSCVAVCLYDKVLKVGGINHFMLPLWNGDGIPTPKYGNIAIEKLILGMLSMGCKKEHLVAKVFGGANQMAGVMNIGERNFEVAEAMLKTFGIPIIAKNVLGETGRKIIYNTKEGSVMMKLLIKRNNE